MYVLKEESKFLLKPYKLKYIAERIGINYRNLSKMINKNKSCIKLTAYALTKFLDKNLEILDLFNRVER